MKETIRAKDIQIELRRIKKGGVARSHAWEEFLLRMKMITPGVGRMLLTSSGDTWLLYDFDKVD